MLASAGGVLGMAIAMAGVPLLTELVPSDLPIAHPPTIDVRVLGFAVVLTIATGLVFGLIPVLRLGRVDVAGLREGARAGSGARERVRGALVVAEVALSVVLLVAAGLLLRAFWTVQRVDPGFRTSGVLTLRTDLPRPRYEATATRVAFYDRVLAEVRALPGVTDAAYIGGLPLVRGGGIWPVTLEGAGDDARRRRRCELAVRHARVTSRRWRFRCGGGVTSMRRTPPTARPRRS